MKKIVCILGVAMSFSAISGVSDIKNSGEAGRLAQVSDDYEETELEPGYQTAGVGGSWIPSIDLSNASGSLSEDVTGSPSISLANTTNYNDDISDIVEENEGSGDFYWQSIPNASYTLKGKAGYSYTKIITVGYAPSEYWITGSFYDSGNTTVKTAYLHLGETLSFSAGSAGCTITPNANKTITIVVTVDRSNKTTGCEYYSSYALLSK